MVWFLNDNGLVIFLGVLLVGLIGSAVFCGWKDRQKMKEWREDDEP